MAIRDLAISRGASTLIFDPRTILENPQDNTREMESESTQAHIREMANAIKENGNELFPPITIYQEGESLFVQSGWCRRRAHVLAMEEGAPIKGIICLSTLKKKPADATLNILNSNDGLELTPIAKARAVKRLVSFLWTPTEIAQKTGKSISTINNLIALDDAPDAILDMVKAGDVSVTLAQKMVREKGTEGAVEALKSAVETSKKAGKRKATQRDIQNVKNKSVSWKKYGPKLFELLKAIYETPATERQKVWEKIANAGELIMEIEEIQGEVKIDSD